MSIRQISHLSFVGYAVIAAILFAACATTSTGPSDSAAPGGSAAASAAPMGTVTVRLSGDWAHIDPQHPTNQTGLQGGQIAAALYDTLIGVDAKGKLVPYLAKSWEQTPTSIKFTLRTDATCVDGTKLTPTVVKNSVERMVKTQGFTSRLGRGPYTVTADEAAGTVTWSTQAAFTDAIYNFTAVNLGAAIVCPAGLANPDGLQQTPQGSGPYVLDSAVRGDHFTVKRREGWTWGPEGITAKDLPERIVFKVVANETTAANLLVAGGVDISQITGTDIERLVTNKELVNRPAVSTQAFPLVFNHDPSRPTADKKVREALVSAVDPKAWNQIVFQGRGVASQSFLAPGADCYDAAIAQYAVRDPSPEKAMQILTGAGWRLVNGKFEKDGKPLTVNLVATPAGMANGPEYLTTQWEKAGITVKLDNIDFNAYVQRLQRSEFDILPEQLSGNPTPNPSDGIRNFLGAVPPTGQNWPRTVNAEAEKELALAQSTIGAERCQHWSNVQRMLLQDFNALPLAAPAVQWFGRGLDFLPLGRIMDPRYIRRAK